MKRRLLDILACPMDKHYPLILIEFESKDDVITEGVLICEKCGRYYPILDEIPIMLPDDRRNEKEDLEFLQKWVEQLPESIVYTGKPFNLARKLAPT